MFHLHKKSVGGEGSGPNKTTLGSLSDQKVPVYPLPKIVLKIIYEKGNIANFLLL